MSQAMWNLWAEPVGGEIIDMLPALSGGIDPRRRDELSGPTPELRSAQEEPHPYSKGQSAESRARGRACLGR